MAAAAVERSPGLTVDHRAGRRTSPVGFNTGEANAPGRALHNACMPYVAVSTGFSATTGSFLRMTPESKPSFENNLYVFALPES